MFFWQAIGGSIAKLRNMKFIATSFLLSLTFFLNSTVTYDHLKVFEGEWAGELTYLNYGDDETLVTLPLTLEATMDTKGVKFAYFYTEPGGTIEKRNGSFQLREDKVILNGKWELVGSEITNKQNWTMELKSTGKDNNRRADFQKFVEVTPNKITITKKVRYKGTETFFMRNQHVFQR